MKYRPIQTNMACFNCRSHDCTAAVYTIPTSQNTLNVHASNRQNCKRIKCGFCVISWTAFLILLIYLAIHYDLLYKVIGECKESLENKSRNESLLRAHMGELKQKNAYLNNEFERVNKELVHAQELYSNAQDKIQLYVKTIEELKNFLPVIREVVLQIYQVHYTALG